MASTVGAVASKQVLVRLKDIHNETGNKEFLVMGTTTNADIQSIIDNTFNLSNVGVLKGSVLQSAPITGMPASAVNSPYDGISMGIALIFSQISPYNPAVTLYKSYFIPGAIEAMLQNDHVSVIVPNAAAAAGTPAKLLGDLIPLLEGNLAAYIKSNNSYVNGGWTYQPSLSKLSTFLRELDGNPNT